MGHQNRTSIGVFATNEEFAVESFVVFHSESIIDGDGDNLRCFVVWQSPWDPSAGTATVG